MTGTFEIVKGFFVQVEITIKVLGSENETAEQLLGRVSAVLRNQPQILVHDVSEEKPKPKKIAAADEDTPKKGPGRPSKKKEKDPEPEEELEELEEVEDEIEVEEDEDDADDKPEEDEKPKKSDSKKSAKGPTIEGDVIPAFKALTKEYGNGAGAEILRMFKVTSVRDLEDDDIPKVLKAIKAYKPKKK